MHIDDKIKIFNSSWNNINVHRYRTRKHIGNVGTSQYLNYFFKKGINAWELDAQLFRITQTAIKFTIRGTQLFRRGIADA